MLPASIAHSVIGVNWEIDGDSFANGGWLLPVWLASLQHRGGTSGAVTPVGVSFDPLGTTVDVYRTSPMGLLHPGGYEIPWSKVDEVCETGEPRAM